MILLECIAFLGIPWTLGISVAMLGHRQKFSLFHILGLGYLLGLFCLAILLWGLSAWGIGITFAKTAVISLAISLTLLTYSFRNRKVHFRPSIAQPFDWQTSTLLFLFLCYLCMLAYFAVLKPTYSWDAIGHWAYQAKFWHETGYPNVQEFTIGTPGPIISLIIYWGMVCSANSESTVWHSAWAFIPIISLILLSATSANTPNQRRAFIVISFLLASTPLVTTHTLLAGYADLWLAYGILALNINIFFLLQEKSLGALLVTVLLAVCCVMTKKSGLIYVLICLLHWLAYFFTCLTTQQNQLWLTRIYLLSILILPILLWLISAMEINHGGVDVAIANFPRVVIQPHNSTPYFIESLFLGMNWNLAFYLFLPALYYRYFRKNAAPLTGIDVLPMASLGIGTFLLALTSSTDLYFEWSANATSLNRLIMSLFPLFCVGCTLALTSTNDYRYSQQET